MSLQLRPIRDKRCDPLRKLEWLEDEPGMLHWVPTRSASACHLQWERLVEAEVRGPIKTACKQSLTLTAPGIFSRLGAPRCPLCCYVASIPYGDGAWINDPASEVPDD